jgi:hypothetical protein
MTLTIAVNTAVIFYLKQPTKLAPSVIADRDKPALILL